MICILWVCEHTLDRDYIVSHFSFSVCPLCLYYSFLFSSSTLPSVSLLTCEHTALSFPSPPSLSLSIYMWSHMNWVSTLCSLCLEVCCSHTVVSHAVPGSELCWSISSPELSCFTWCTDYPDSVFIGFIYHYNICVLSGVVTNSNYMETTYIYTCPTENTGVTVAVQLCSVIGSLLFHFISQKTDQSNLDNVTHNIANQCIWFAADWWCIISFTGFHLK